MRVIVITGAREWADPEPIKDALRGADMVIVGDCPPDRSTRASADAMALAIARQWNVAVTVYAAAPARAEFLRKRGVHVEVVSDWRRDGANAGPKRNTAIAAAATAARAAGLDVYCHAFPLPGSRGTHDCARRLKAEGFEVHVHLARNLQQPAATVERARTRIDRGLAATTAAGLEIVGGDILKYRADALVNPVNTVGVMGKGLALAFKRAFPENYATYARACLAGHLKPGQVLVAEREEAPRHILNVATKSHWRAPSQLQYVRVGLNLSNIVERVHALQIHSIAIPALGCGEGGLPWIEVKPLLERAAAQMPNVRVTLFAPYRELELVAASKPHRGGLDIER